MDEFWAAPPVSRTLAASALVVSALGFAGVIPLMPLIFIPHKVFPQIWRVATSFLITGPSLGILLDPFFLFRYGSELERGSPRFTLPGDFFTYIVFVGLVIVVLSGFFLHGAVFCQPLILALTYTYAQDNPTSMVSFFVITMQAKFLPYAMLFMTFVMAGPGPAMQQGTGIVAAHLYDFLNRIWPTFGGGGKEPWIKTPGFVRRAFGGDTGAPVKKDYGTVFPGRPAAQQGAAPAATGSQGGTWTSGNSWGSRGPGRRLGS